MIEQLDLFHRLPDEPPPPVVPEPASNTVLQAEEPRTQLIELPGTTFDDIFAGPPSRVRSAA